jgi:tetratricopeptide (TPR) repeat protein
MLEREGKATEALEVMEKAGVHLPRHPAVWNAQGILWQRTNRWAEAYRAFSKAIELTESGTEFKNVRAKALSSRSDVLQRLGRGAEARADFLQAKGIPPRDGQARSNLIDLTPHYNAGLGENWRGLYEHDDLAALPVGLQQFGGVEFDVRGVVQVSGQWLRRQGRKFPERIEGLKLGRTCQSLHFLHAAGYVSGAANGTAIARYVVHFANGKKQDIPVIYGRDVLRHWVRSAPTNSAAGPVPAWMGKAGPTNAPAAGLSPALYQTTWPNPWPEVPIESLDFVSAMTDVDAFLVGLTVEPAPDR